MRTTTAASIAVGFSLALTPAAAGVWTAPGDAALRSDIELLASAGVVDNVTTQWPMPWPGLLKRLGDHAELADQPDYIRQIADRLAAGGQRETKADTLRASLLIDGASTPSVVRGFDALGRQAFQSVGTVEYASDSTVVHLALGARTVTKTDKQVFVPDGSYIAQRLGGAVVYAGYMPHWWGPGWISALGLSTNARPIPQIGISRVSTAPFETPWLSWIGPWQAEFFVGVLDGPRVARNTIYDGFRFTSSPLPHLEIGLARTDMMCGTGHPCKPLVGYFHPINGSNGPNIVNDEGTIDVRYSNMIGRWAFSVYAQAMNEDNYPFVKSGSSHLVGGSVWAPLDDGIARLTVEYADSVATRDLFGGDAMHGYAYNNWQYPDGMRYRGRTLGFSLDSDSRLTSVQADYTDQAGRSFRLSYHHAEVSTPQNTLLNAVTTAPVLINMLQARLSIPLEFAERQLRFDVEARLQDDQPRPNKGALAAIEAALNFGL